MSPMALMIILFLVGTGLVVAGAQILFGLGVSLITAGIFSIASAIILSKGLTGVETKE